MNRILTNLAGWIMSEKLDGARCIWTGSHFTSRNGRDFNPPAWWLEGMPDCRLDGELWNHRGGFDELVSAIQRKRNAWEGVTFQIFDLAVLRTPIEARHAALARLQLPAHAQLVPHRACLSMGDLDATEAEIVKAGGEGVVLREAASLYTPTGFVKVKRLFPDLNRSILD